MNSHRTIRTAIAAITGGAALLAGPFGVDAANRPSPDINMRPKPTVVIMVDATNRPSPDINKRPKPTVVIDGFHHPSPDRNKMPKPAAVAMPCPAVDDIPDCDLQRTTLSNPVTVTSLRSAAAAGGAVTTLNPGRVTPSPR